MAIDDKIKDLEKEVRRKKVKLGMRRIKNRMKYGMKDMLMQYALPIAFGVYHGVTSGPESWTPQEFGSELATGGIWLGLVFPAIYTGMGHHGDPKDARSWKRGAKHGAISTGMYLAARNVSQWIYRLF